MFDDRARTLLILPRGVLDDLRVLAGKATSTLKLSVSVQIVLRALVEEGLKRDGDQSLLANIREQAQTVRRIRSLGGRRRRRDSRSGRTEDGRERDTEARDMTIGGAMPGRGGNAAWESSDEP